MRRITIAGTFVVALATAALGENIQAQPTPVTFTEFSVTPGSRRLDCVMSEPATLAKNPAVLIHFDTDRDQLRGESIYGLTCKAFLEAGHRVVGFDMPNHGTRVGHGKKQGIAGFCESFLAGVDPFKMIVEDGRAVVDEIVKRGWAPQGRIFIAGCSRCGYCALRIMAADKRIAAAAVDAPVTDWRALTEFAGAKDRPDVTALALTNYATDLVGRPIWVGMGNCDNRVSTADFMRFCLAISEEQERRKMQKSQFEAHVIKCDGHSFPEKDRKQGAAWLVNQAAR